MKPNAHYNRLELRLITTAAIFISLPLFAAFASAREGAQEAAPPRYTAPAEIDRAVAEFTGAAIGTVGGARVPADPRLRLAKCAQPLDVSWHGRAQSTVKVSCAGPQSWRIFVATKAPEPAANAASVVARGDPITVVVRGRGFTVQQSGEAMEAGAAGDWIAVRMQARAEAIRARIVRPGLAVIPTE